jgi:hypothetical protein
MGQGQGQGQDTAGGMTRERTRRLPLCRLGSGANPSLGVW